MQSFRLLISALVLAASASVAIAQGTQVPFGGLQHDTSLPVEISADQLSINQSDGTAVFSGNVLIGQGSLRLSAGTVLVEYSAGEGQSTGQIARLLASGGITLVNGAEAAEAQEAEYTIDTGTIILIGNVILTQGANVISSERMVINLNSGIATLDGRVQTIFQTGGN
ncbi:MAG: LptA/OstA family protein [Paracoccaceae bacterium]